MKAGPNGVILIPCTGVVFDDELQQLWLGM